MDDWLTQRSRTHARRSALIAPDGSLTYSELDACAGAWARRLAALGVASGDRVATTLPAGLGFAALLHALPRVGAVLVPLNTRLTAAERRLQLADAGARVVVEEPLDGDQADIELRVEVDPRAPLALMYTSGTTGAPKRVALTYANFLASAVASAWNLGVSPEDRWLCPMPLFHVGGLSILTRSCIYGTAAVIHARFDAAAVAHSLESGEATLVSLVATMLSRLRDGGLGPAPALRAALIGGGPVPRELLVWASGRGLPVLQTYGMTETASQVVTLGAAEALAKLGSAGRPLPGVELSVTAAGEILVRGSMVARGALNAADGWLHTGDRGRLDADGYLYVEGRIKDTIVTGGENVAAAEVEEVLLSHRDVADAAVVGFADAEWGERVGAFVVVCGEVSDAALIEHCRARLAGYKVPRTIRRIDAIPRTATGKILKGRLVDAADRVPAQ